MTLETVQDLLELIITDHDGGLSYFNGLETDFNAKSKKNFPAIVIVSIQTNFILNNIAEPVQQFVINGFSADSYPENRPPDLYNQILGRSYGYLRDIFLRLLQYSDSSIKLNDETLDFVITSPVTMLDYKDEKEYNSAGHVFTITLNDNLRISECCIEERFKTAI